MDSLSASERESVAADELDKTDINFSQMEKDYTKEAPGETLHTSSDKIPDGGFFAWLQVAGAFCIFFNTWSVNILSPPFHSFCLSITNTNTQLCRGVVNSYGVYQHYYSLSRQESQSDSEIAWIGSMQGFLLLFVSIITGPLYDAGYLRALVYGGTFLTIFGMMMTSICQTYGELLVAQGIVVGIGDGLLFLPSIVIVSQYFDKKRALATGIASMGSSIGQFDPRSPHRSLHRFLIHTRRCHLPRRLPPTPARYRICLDHSCHRLHHARHLHPHSPLHQTACTIHVTPKSLRHLLLPRLTLPSLLLRPLLWLHGHLHRFLLCRAVRDAGMRHEP